MNTSPGPSPFDNTEPASSHSRTFINPIVWFDDCDSHRVVFCRHEILYRVALSDPPHLALVAVTLRQSKLATQVEIAAAFGGRAGPLRPGVQCPAGLRSYGWCSQLRALPNVRASTTLGLSPPVVEALT